MSGHSKDELLVELETISHSSAIYPQIIMRLSHRCAEALKDDEEFAATLASKVWEYAGTSFGNAFVRRVIFGAFRQAGKKEYKSIDLPGILEQGLSDPDDWVRYDAAWAIGALGIATFAILERLADIAQGFDENAYDPRSFNPSDAAANAAKRAHDTLKLLTAPTG